MSKDAFQAFGWRIPFARGIIVGFGVLGYRLAIRAHTTSRRKPEGTWTP